MHARHVLNLPTSDLRVRNSQRHGECVRLQAPPRCCCCAASCRNSHRKLHTQGTNTTGAYRRGGCRPRIPSRLFYRRAARRQNTLAAQQLPAARGTRLLSSWHWMTRRDVLQSRRLYTVRSMMHGLSPLLQGRETQPLAHMHAHSTVESCSDLLEGNQLSRVRVTRPIAGRHFGPRLPPPPRPRGRLYPTPTPYPVTPH